MPHFQTFDQALHYAGFSERDHQRAVFDAFRAGKHIILHAPTGWGKTFAVAAALAVGHAIYSLPLRVLVDSLIEGVKRRIRKHCAAHHGNRREHELLDKGEDPSNPIDLVFTTLDQTLSAFLGIPIGVSLRQGNVLPAVVDASHLIFDEFHLFDPERSLAVALLALQRSPQNGVILTATLSEVMIEFLEEELRRSPVGRQNGVAVIRGNRPFVNEKKVRRGDGFASLETLELGRRTLIIRNQVEWAKQTARNLRRRFPDKQVYLLHSELLPHDRQRIEEAVRSAFGEDSTASAILVATQVVEAGIDITCDVLHTDACPPDAFIQRAGRCARYKGESGVIYWHPSESEMPYRNRGAEITALDACIGDNLDLTPEAEQDIVNLTSERDQIIARHFRENHSQRVVNEARVSQDYSIYDKLIREINSINVAIGEDPNKPRKYISISRTKFMGNGVYSGLPASFYRYNSELKEHVSTERVLQADFVLLDPEYVGYDGDYGLDLECLGGEQAFLEPSQKTRTAYGYTLESYEQHIRLLWEKKPIVRWMIEKLGQHLTQEYGGDGAAAAEMLVDFVIWAHDLGKLDGQWQAAHGVPPKGVPPDAFPPEVRPSAAAPIAHSESDKDSPYRRQRTPPSHAWVSAWAVRDHMRAFCQAINDEQKRDALFKAIYWAISDHHGYSQHLSLDRHHAYRLSYLGYLDAISQQEPWVPYGWSAGMLTTKINPSERERVRQVRTTNDRLLATDDLTTYFTLSYILRRCDQLATAEVSRVEQYKVTSEINSFML
jgi:CRISPR-associated endonuclease/helicase Cas3